MKVVGLIPRPFSSVNKPPVELRSEIDFTRRVGCNVTTIQFKSFLMRHDDRLRQIESVKRFVSVAAFNHVSPK